MRQEHAQDIYTLYDRFINDFLFEGNSILSAHQGILNDQTINNCIQYFIENFDEGIESFDEKIARQFTDAEINTKLVFAHAEWLWAYSVHDISIEKKKEYTVRTTNLSDAELYNSNLDDWYSIRSHSRPNHSKSL